MNETCQIDEVIRYLQYLKKDNAVLTEIKIDFGYRYAIPGEEKYCEYADTKILDGSFLMTIKGKSNKI